MYPYCRCTRFFYWILFFSLSQHNVCPRANLEINSTIVYKTAVRKNTATAPAAHALYGWGICSGIFIGLKDLLLSSDVDEEEEEDVADVDVNDLKLRLLQYLTEIMYMYAMKRPFSRFRPMLVKYSMMTRKQDGLPNATPKLHTYTYMNTQMHK